MLYYRAYFIDTTAAGIVVGGNRADPERNSRPPSGCWRTFPRTTSGVAEWAELLYISYVQQKINIFYNIGIKSRHILVYIATLPQAYTQ